MQSVLEILYYLTQAVFYLVLIQLILGLLIQFDVANPRHPMVRGVYLGIGQILDPVLNPIRRILPPAGGLDFSPMVLLLGLTVIQIVIRNNI